MEEAVGAEYEAMRLRNIARNNEKLRQLQLASGTLGDATGGGAQLRANKRAATTASLQLARTSGADEPYQTALSYQARPQRSSKAAGANAAPVRTSGRARKKSKHARDQEETDRLLARFNSEAVELGFEEMAALSDGEDDTIKKAEAEEYVLGGDEAAGGVGGVGGDGGGDGDDDDEDSDDVFSSDTDGQGQALGKRRRRRKMRRKDPNHPKRCKPAFMFFSIATRPDLLAQNPSLSFIDIAHKTGELYRALLPEERAKWDQLAEEDRQRYQSEMASYVPPAEPVPPAEGLADNRDVGVTEPSPERSNFTSSSGVPQSQYPGVCWDKITGKWKARHKGSFLGYFCDELAAARACAAARQDLARQGLPAGSAGEGEGDMPLMKRPKRAPGGKTSRFRGVCWCVCQPPPPWVQACR
jgi:hypothetical protein